MPKIFERWKESHAKLLSDKSKEIDDLKVKHAEDLGIRDELVRTKQALYDEVKGKAEALKTQLEAALEENKELQRQAQDQLLFKFGDREGSVLSTGNEPTSMSANTPGGTSTGSGSVLNLATPYSNPPRQSPAQSSPMVSSTALQPSPVPSSSSIAGSQGRGYTPDSTYALGNPPPAYDSFLSGSSTSTGAVNWHGGSNTAGATMVGQPFSMSPVNHPQPMPPGSGLPSNYQFQPPFNVDYSTGQPVHYDANGVIIPPELFNQTTYIP